MNGQLSNNVDVLIVGAGPAGLMMALWMSKLGVRTRLVDQRLDKMSFGQADSLNERSQEILDSFGISHHMSSEAYSLYELAFWGPTNGGRIVRNDRATDIDFNLSRFGGILLPQRRIEEIFLGAIKSSLEPVHVSWGVTPYEVDIDEALAAKANELEDQEIGDDAAQIYPVRVKIQHTTEQATHKDQVVTNMNNNDSRGDVSELEEVKTAKNFAENIETVHARYVIGCDGAHSWIRKALGPDYQMQGSSTESPWGVMDFIPITDFPDIRAASVVESDNHGSLMMVPRENRLVRIYVQLGKSNTQGTQHCKGNVTPEAILEAVRAIMKPYSITYQYLDWWSVFQVGQRLAPKLSKLGRIFLAGDAVHTHSPKAGLGMNTSIQDTYNLGWKIGLVCKGLLRHRALSTYDSERGLIAKQLVTYDMELNKTFRDTGECDLAATKAPEAVKAPGAIESPEAIENPESIENPEAMGDIWSSEKLMLSGIGVRYEPSILSSLSSSASLDSAWNGISDLEVDFHLSKCGATVSERQNLVGLRFPSQKFICQADASIWELDHCMKSTGQFRIVVSGADISHPEQLSLVNSIAGWLSGLQDRYGTIRWPSQLRLRPDDTHDLPIIDILLLHSAPRESIELLTDLHHAYHPFDKTLGWHYEKVFTTNCSYSGYPAMNSTAYDVYGLEGPGRLFAIRPDGHVGLCESLDDSSLQERVTLWFQKFLQQKFTSPEQSQ